MAKCCVRLALTTRDRLRGTRDVMELRDFDECKFRFELLLLLMSSAFRWHQFKPIKVR